MDQYKLTKLDVSAIRAADDLVVRMHADGVTRVTLTKRGAPKSLRHAFGTEDKQHDIAATVRCRCNWSPVPEDARPVCFELLYLYSHQTTPEGTILFSLRAGDEVEFQFAPDYGSSPLIVDAGLYADALLLHVKRGSKRMVYVLARQVSRNDSARMIFGAPDSPSRVKRRQEHAA